MLRNCETILQHDNNMFTKFPHNSHRYRLKVCSCTVRQGLTLEGLVSSMFATLHWRSSLNTATTEHITCTREQLQSVLECRGIKTQAVKGLRLKLVGKSAITREEREGEKITAEIQGQ